MFRLGSKSIGPRTVLGARPTTRVTLATSKTPLISSKGRR